MRLSVCRHQALVGDMGIDLRRGQRGVTQDLLDATQVGAALEQMGGHGVPESVWSKIGRPRNPADSGMDDPSGHPGVEPTAALTQKDR